MKTLDLYLSYLNESLDKLKIPKKKWYDLLNMQYKKIVKEEIERIFDKCFTVRHPIVDNSKTQIQVSLPWVGNLWFIELKMKDKKGKDIFNYHHDNNFLGYAFTLTVSKKGNRWHLSHEMLFLKEEYGGKGLGRALIQAANVCFRKLQATKESEFNAVDIGRYAWSKLPGAKFESNKQRDSVEKKYQRWCKLEKQTCKPGKKPTDYPKDFLFSKSAPEFIKYSIPI